MTGVREDAAEFRGKDSVAATGRFRRLAGGGPVYEIVAVHGEQVTARLIERDETFVYPLADARTDPLA